MKETPLIYSTEMIRADLEHRKSVTRRTRGLEIINMSPDSWEYLYFQDRVAHFRERRMGKEAAVKCPYGGPGDMLWIKEALIRHPILNEAVYKADGSPVFRNQTIGDMLRWRWQRESLNSMFMPREACRTTHTLISVRPERLWDITGEDAKAEGVTFKLPHGAEMPEQNALNWYRVAYIELWDSLNAKRGYPWVGNWWVWPLEYDPDEGLEVRPEVKERLLASSARPKEELISMEEMRKRLLQG